MHWGQRMGSDPCFWGQHRVSIILSGQALQTYTIHYISSAGALLEALRLCWPAAQHRIAPWKVERPLAAVPPPRPWLYCLERK